jgi:hypothetical protein
MIWLRARVTNDWKQISDFDHVLLSWLQSAHNYQMWITQQLKHLRTFFLLHTRWVPVYRDHLRNFRPRGCCDIGKVIPLWMWSTSRVKSILRPKCFSGKLCNGMLKPLPIVYVGYMIIGLALIGKGYCVFRFIIEYSSLMDFGP